MRLQVTTCYHQKCLQSDAMDTYQRVCLINRCLGIKPRVPPSSCKGTRLYEPNNLFRNNPTGNKMVVCCLKFINV